MIGFKIKFDMLLMQNWALNNSIYYSIYHKKRNYLIKINDTKNFKSIMASLL